jgi:hypothetical protein
MPVQKSSIARANPVRLQWLGFGFADFAGDFAGVFYMTPRKSNALL